MVVEACPLMTRNLAAIVAVPACRARILKGLVGQLNSGQEVGFCAEELTPDTSRGMRTCGIDDVNARLFSPNLSWCRKNGVIGNIADGRTFRCFRHSQLVKRICALQKAFMDAKPQSLRHLQLERAFKLMRERIIGRQTLAPGETRGVVNSPVEPGASNVTSQTRLNRGNQIFFLVLVVTQEVPVKVARDSQTHSQKVDLGGFRLGNQERHCTVEIGGLRLRGLGGHARGSKDEQTSQGVGHHHGDVAQGTTTVSRGCRSMFWARL